MPDTTPLGFPFPEGSDPVAAGAAAIQDLAEFVDDYVQTEIVDRRLAAAFLARSAAQSIPNASLEEVAWTPGSSIVGTGFTLTTGDTRLQYAGPARWFVVHGLVSWPAQVDAAVRSCYIVGSNVLANEAVDTRQIYLGGSAIAQNVAGLIFLDNGDYLHMQLFHQAGSTMTATPELRVVGL